MPRAQGYRGVEVSRGHIGWKTLEAQGSSQGADTKITRNAENTGV